MVDVKRLWSFSLPRVRNVMPAPPLVHEGLLWASFDWFGRQTYESLLIAFEPTTGDEQWRLPAHGAVCRGAEPVSGGVFWPQMSPPKLRSVDRTGTVRWEWHLDGGNIWAVPVSAGSIVHSTGGTTEGRTQRLVREDGATGWTHREADTLSIPVIGRATTDEELYVTTSRYFDDGVAFALGVDSGRLRWRVTYPNRYLRVGPERDGLLPLFDQQTLRLLDRTTGQETASLEIWPTSTNAHIETSSQAGRWVVVSDSSTRQSEIVVVEAGADAVLSVAWRRRFPEQLASSPVSLPTGDWAVLRSDGHLLIIDPLTGTHSDSGRVVKAGDAYGRLVAHDDLVIAAQGRELVALTLGASSTDGGR
jgi:hypothetical protein